MRLSGGAHLTYCTNIHPGESWTDVRAVLARNLPVVAGRVARGRPFGVGLRLSAQAARELDEDPRAFAELTTLLSEVNGYVPTLNGFPYGEFHRGSVKEGVYLPDWHEPARVDYTLCLARLAVRLAQALPHAPPNPSISTVPGCFRQSLRAGSLEQMGANLRRVALDLARLAADTGIAVTLGLEPEPACLLETTAEGIEFLGSQVHDASSLASEAATLGVSPADLVDAARRHIGLCLDACHAAVGFESATEVVALLRQKRVLVTKIQVTSALSIEAATAEDLEELVRFSDGVYLHQVSVMTPAGLRRFVDLPDALADETLLGQPWRVHFHVPVSAASVGRLGTTRSFLEELLLAQRESPLSDQLEVETYTYDVLPSAHRARSACDVICQELEWTRERLRA